MQPLAPSPAKGFVGARPRGLELERGSNDAAVVDLYVRSDFPSAGRPDVESDSALSVKMLTQRSLDMGWQRYSYLVMPSPDIRDEDGTIHPFQEKRIIFSHPAAPITAPLCVSYGQLHEHTWYCAIAEPNQQ